MQVVNSLLNNGANIDSTNIMGDTALHFAVHLGNYDMVLLLAKFSPNLNLINKDGHSALNLASLSNKTNIYSFLVNEYNKLEESGTGDTNSSNYHLQAGSNINNVNSSNVNSNINIHNIQNNNNNNTETIQGKNKIDFENVLKEKRLNSIGEMNSKSDNFMFKTNKSAKLQKLNLLKERRGGNIKNNQDKVYKFPLVHSNGGNLSSNNNLSSIEIPFSFNNSNEKNAPKLNQGNHLHSFISNIFFFTLNSLNFKRDSINSYFAH